VPRDPDDRLVERTLAGDLRAFELLVTRYRSALYSLAYRMAGDREEAHDLAQEAFVRAYRALRTYRCGGRFAAWLYAIAVNVCTDALRSKRCRSEPLPNPGVHVLGCSEYDPQSLYERSEMQEMVQQALGQLPVDQRLAIVLGHLQGLTYREAAEITGKPVGTLKSHAHRGRARLKQLLARYLEDDLT